MKTPSIYLDTSVIGGCFDSEFKIWSNALIDDIHRGLFIGVISELVEAEIFDAPLNIQEKYFEFLNLNPKILKLDEESFALVESYLSRELTSYGKE
ncbi:MAG: hypothetical protein EHM72_16350 [Calditrichaeota bacterium]|nr:MAG: hypothetical protein EHM72_16350 [Calditrichota bacterium]